MKNLFLLLLEERVPKFYYYQEGLKENFYKKPVPEIKNKANFLKKISELVNELDTSQKENLKKLILKYCSASEYSSLKELSNLSKEMNNIFGKGETPSVGKNKNIETMLAKEVNPFPEGKDSLQIKLQQKKDGYAGYIDPEKGLMYFTPSGKKIYDSSLTIEEVIVNDLSGLKVSKIGVNGKISENYSLQETIPDKNYLIEAIKYMNPKTRLSEEDAEIIFGSIQGSFDFISPENLKNSIYQNDKNNNPTQISVARLQIAFSNISPEFEKVVNGIDGKYGEKTRTGVRTLGAMLRDILKKYEIKVKKNIDLEKNDVVFNYLPYKNIVIGCDRSSSMKPHVESLSDKLGTIKDHSEKKSFGFFIFEKTAEIITPLTKGTKGLNGLINGMKEIKGRGSTEYAIKAGIKMLQNKSLFPEKEKLLEEKNNILLELWTDENIQGVSPRDILEIEELSKEKGVDVFIILINRGKKKERVPLYVLKEMLIGPVFNSKIEKEQIKMMKKMVKQIESGASIKIENLSSYAGDPIFLEKMCEYKELSK